MKTSEITTKTVNFMERAIKTHLLRFGINVEVSIKITEKFIYVKTSEFQTFPVMFSKIWVDGVGQLMTDSDDDIYIYIPLSYRYNRFTGGENGADIGYMKFYLCQNNKGEQYAYTEGISTFANVPYTILDED